MIESFVSGLTYPARAFGVLMRTPRLWAFILIPLLVNLVVVTFNRARLSFRAVARLSQ